MKNNYRLYAVLILLLSCDKPAVQEAKTLSVSPTMVDIKGGLVKVGPYDKDSLNWGERLTFIKPCSISIKPSKTCNHETHYMPSFAQVDHALRTKQI